MAGHFSKWPPFCLQDKSAMALYLKMFVWSYSIIVPNFKYVSQSARFEHQPLHLGTVIRHLYIYITEMSVCLLRLEGVGGGLAGGGRECGQEGGRQWGGGFYDGMPGGHRLYRAIKQKCLSGCHIWRQVAGEAGRVDRKEGRISQMECLGGHEVTEFSN